MNGFTQRTSFHLLLLSLTFVSVFGVFLFGWGGGVSGGLDDRVWGSVMFTVCALLILGAHEMGHYLMARAHGVDTSLPYFIPFPLPLGFGTLGAVIRLKGKVPHRNALVDIGAAGPLAGLLIAVPLLVVGVKLSPVVDSDAAAHFPPKQSLWHLAELVGWWLREQVRGIPAPAEGADFVLFGDNLLMKALTYLEHGPLPPGKDLAAHPVLLAAWFGMLVTMLNLLPVGQLDGGHLTHAWLGERAVRVGRVFAGLLLPLALFGSASWLVWFFITTRVVGFGHPPVTDESQPLSWGRKVVCVVALVAAVLTFMPVPLDSA